MNFCLSSEGNGLAILFTRERAKRESREFLTKGLVLGRKVITNRMVITITTTPLRKPSIPPATSSEISFRNFLSAARIAHRRKNTRKYKETRSVINATVSVRILSATFWENREAKRGKT